MNKNLIAILKVFNDNKMKLFKRKDIEKLIPYVRKRALINYLNQLEEHSRIKIQGVAASTVYSFSSFYHEKFEELLYIYQNQSLIGYLAFYEAEYYFAYDTEYLLQDKRYVKFQMPFSLETFTQPRCFLDFEETLPEGIDRKILSSKAGTDTDFFLLKYNNYAQNDLVFSDKKLYFNKSLKQYGYLTIKDTILGKNNSFPTILHYDIELSDEILFPNEEKNENNKEIRTISLSGYQHKTHITLDDKTIRVPQSKDDICCFIKPYNKNRAKESSKFYFPHLSVNEHLHLTFAKNELLFDVPFSAIFKRENDVEFHYLVKYFDRHKGYKFQRKELATFMGLNSESKYETSSEKLFDTIKEILPLEKERLRALEYYLYSFVIKHEDLHTKNLSILIDADKLFISPLYDMAATGIYQNTNGYESHLSIAGKQSKIKLQDFHQLCKRADVSIKDFNTRAKFIIQSYIDKMPSYIKNVKKCGLLPFSFMQSKKAYDIKQTKRSVKFRTILEEVFIVNYLERLNSFDKQGWAEALDLNLTNGMKDIEKLKKYIEKNKKYIAIDFSSEKEDAFPKIKTYLS